MNRFFSNQRNLLTAILLTICLLVPTSGCAAGVSQEEYDQLESELAQVTAELDQTKQDLAAARQEAAAAEEEAGALQAVRSLWPSVEPLVQIALIRIENQRDYHLWQTGEITQMEYFSRTSQLWAKVNACLGEIGNEEFAEKLEAAWFEPWGGDNDRLWAEANSLHLSLAQEALGELSNKLGK